jgi:hypothetical protein
MKVKSMDYPEMATDIRHFVSPSHGGNSGSNPLGTPLRGNEGVWQIDWNWLAIPVPS